MVKKNIWRGGPRSSRSYKLDMYRQSKEPWEQRRKLKGRYGVTSVTSHYRTSKKGKSVSVQSHRRRYR